MSPPSSPSTHATPATTATARPDGGSAHGPDHPGLVPAMLLPVDGPVDGPTRRRTARDWFIDVLAFLLSIGLGAGVLALVKYDNARPMTDADVWFDAAIGLVGCVLLWWRRRWPVVVCLVLAAIGAVSAFVAIAGSIALFTVAVHRPARTVVPLAVANIALGMVYQLLYPDPTNPLWQAFLWTVGMTLILVAWAMFVRARRQLVLSLRERAERAENEQRMLADQARYAERSRIAREMHDVLAHRVSLIALQAGGLEVRPDLPTDEVQKAARLIRSTSRRALEELRDVIGVLREASEQTGTPQPPQPTLADIPSLVEQFQEYGGNVTLEQNIDAMEKAPGVLNRAAYRIVQEALTNVHKHAQGAEARVRISGGPGEGLRVVVRNRLRARASALPGSGPGALPGSGAGTLPGSGSALPGSGTGLVGLAERVALSGGTLSHGPTSDGEFVVDATLEWSR